MRSFDSATLTALAQGSLVIRHFIWITPRHLTTGVQQPPVGYWTDLETKTLDVVDGVSGAVVSRSYLGSGKIASLDQIVHEEGIAVRSIGVSLNILDDSVENLIRGFNLRKAPFEWHFALLDVNNRNVVGYAYPLFVGFVNTIKIATATISGESTVSVEAVSDTRRLTIKSGLKRSDENQRLRSDDRAFQYAEAMRSREVFWGTKKASSADGPKARGFLGALQDATRRGRH